MDSRKDIIIRKEFQSSETYIGSNKLWNLIKENNTNISAYYVRKWYIRNGIFPPLGDMKRSNKMKQKTKKIVIYDKTKKMKQKTKKIIISEKNVVDLLQINKTNLKLLDLGQVDSFFGYRLVKNYLFFYNEKCIYVGTTICLYSRFSGHHILKKYKDKEIYVKIIPQISEYDLQKIYKPSDNVPTCIGEKILLHGREYDSSLWSSTKYIDEFYGYYHKNCSFTYMESFLTQRNIYIKDTKIESMNNGNFYSSKFHNRKTNKSLFREKKDIIFLIHMFYIIFINCDKIVDFYNIYHVHKPFIIDESTNKSSISFLLWILEIIFNDYNNTIISKNQIENCRRRKNDNYSFNIRLNQGYEYVSFIGIVEIIYDETISNKKFIQMIEKRDFLDILFNTDTEIYRNNIEFYKSTTNRVRFYDELQFKTH